jgi:hypothetical protein
MRTVTRRSLLLSLPLAPLACAAGCGGESATVDAKAGEKRSRKAEELQKKASLARSPQKGKTP